MTDRTSRLPGFYKRTLAERADLVAAWAGLTPDERAVLAGAGLTAEQGDHMIENVVGTYALPLAIATNFVINGRDVLVPMVIEEPSVLAAVSFAAKLFREGGGFTAETDPPIMIGQIQVLDVPDMAAAEAAVREHTPALLARADEVGGSIVKRGGGARGIETRVLAETAVGPMLIVHLLMDTRDAMGANAINTAVEHLAPTVEAITGGRVNLRILSNLTGRRRARAYGRIPAAALATDLLDGRAVGRAIVEAWAFADADPYRAATHNKGIMNGIDPVVIATGNDWRAVEAGAHAWAAHTGRYRSLTAFAQDEAGDLRASIELPLALGVVGGATRVHATAQVALKVLGVEDAAGLAGVCAAVGLAQNLAALRALATDGIQSGHMRMHAKQLAAAAGARPEWIPGIVARMISEGVIRAERARALVAEWDANGGSAGR
jgi:hydroxymethylglutaryl-CoA reductase